MVYTVDLSGDLTKNEIFLLIKDIVIQSQKKSKENVKKSLLLLLQKIFESGSGDEGAQEIKQQIAILLAKAEKRADGEPAANSEPAADSEGTAPNIETEDCAP